MRNVLKYGECVHGYNLASCSKCRRPKSSDLVSIEHLMCLLRAHKGRIVSTASLSVESINQARAARRMHVDDNGFGYVWEPDIDNMPITDVEIELLEKFYPLDHPMPDELKTADWIFDKLNRKRIKK